MWFTHPDDMLKLAQMRQVELLSERQRDASAADSRATSPRWRTKAVRILKDMLNRPSWVADDTAWPILSEYPYPWS
jgi:hypothetical protein